MVEFLLIIVECFVDFWEKIEQDEFLQKLKYVIKVGWFDKKEEVLIEIRNYFYFKEEFII